jgi:Cd2+/Zn2+-exporting ATPase
MEQKDFKIQGMDCAEEVSALKKTVGRLEGVGGLEFDIMSGRMVVEYDPQEISTEDILDGVREAGLKGVPWEDRSQEGGGADRRRLARLILTCGSGVLLLAGFLSHWILHGSMMHALAAGGGEQGHIFPRVSLFCYAGAIILGVWFVAPKALSAARRLQPDMNLLMILAVTGAVLIGEWFEAGTVSFLFALALLLENWSVRHARESISSLMDLAPDIARCRVDATGDFVEKPVAEVDVGSVAIVRPGEKIPLDGVVKEGISSVNQAPITGESRLVRKVEGDSVYAGTINQDGVLEFEVIRRAKDTTLAKIIHMVQEAQSRRAAAEQWVEKFARYYTPAVLLLAGFIAVIPPLLMGAMWMEWIYRGLVILVIACPCALVISTPVTVVSGLASAARNGILVKGGLYLEEVARLRGLAVDKTGTLTHGRPEVQRVVPLFGHSADEILAIAVALETHSEHPVGRAIRDYAVEKGIEAESCKNFRALKGRGAEGVINGDYFWIGGHRLMEEKVEEGPEAHETAEALEDAGHTVVALGDEGHVYGFISIADTLRDGVFETISRLRGLGVERVVMLTGDNDGTARAIAEAAGIEDYYSEQLPEDKQAKVEGLTEELGTVGMVGDGVNDAPAMAVSSVSIAMGAIGSDVAIETADVALMSDEFSKLPWLLWHARRALRVIKENIFFALSVKALFFVLAIGGVATLWMAIAADMGASLLVIFNGLRLLKSNRQ